MSWLSFKPDFPDNRPFSTSWCSSLSSRVAFSSEIECLLSTQSGHSWEQCLAWARAGTKFIVPKRDRRRLLRDEGQSQLCCAQTQDRAKAALKIYSVPPTNRDAFGAYISGCVGPPFTYDGVYAQRCPVVLRQLRRGTFDGSGPPSRRHRWLPNGARSGRRRDRLRALFRVLRSP